MKKRFKTIALTVAVAALVVASTGCSRVAEQSENVAVVRTYNSEESSRFDLQDGFYYDTEKDCYIGHETDPIELVIHDNESIESVLSDLGEVTEIYEILNSNLEFKQICDSYVNARKEGNIEKAQNVLSKLSLMVLKAQIAEYFDISDINSIKLLPLETSISFLVEFEEKVSRVVPGGVEVEETVTRKYSVIGSGFNNIFDNIVLLQNGKVVSFDELDDMYIDMLYNTVLKLKPVQGESVDGDLTETESSIRKLHLGGRIRY